MKLSEFCEGLRVFLDLDSPYELRIMSKPHAWAAGFCEQRMRKGKITKHVITLYIPTIEASGFDFYGVIAHEFVHAWQAENGLLWEGAYHDETFAVQCHRVAVWAADQGIDIGPVYHPETDVD
jgi:hypothetical protein